MSISEVSVGWVMTPVPLLPDPLVAVSGEAKARRFGSVRTVSMPAAALRVGVILKLSPALRPPPLSDRVNPSITGGGVSVRSKLPMSVPSGNLRTL
ncbi:hypothetical protein D3C75_634980 [compost metagenome]